jgi:hypothetical protein
MQLLQRELSNSQSYEILLFKAQRTRRKVKVSWIAKYENGYKITRREEKIATFDLHTVWNLFVVLRTLTFLIPVPARFSCSHRTS